MFLPACLNAGGNIGEGDLLISAPPEQPDRGHEGRTHQSVQDLALGHEPNRTSRVNARRPRLP